MPSAVRQPTSMPVALADDATLAQRLRREGPMNLERAYEIMERFELDGLVLGEPVNVYHLLGYWPQLANTRVGQPPTTFAILTRDTRHAPALVASRFIYYYSFVDGGFARDLQVYLYQEAGDAAGAGSGASAAIPDASAEFPDRHRAPLSGVERRRRAGLDSATAAHGSMADAGGALVRALRDMGLWGGRIACDHALIGAVCAHHGCPGALVPGDNIMRWIRLVKSPLEIELLRRAASQNVAALTAVASSIRAGATHPELRRAFDIAAAERGSRAVFLNVDRVSSELSEDRILDGQAFFVDGVSHYRHYHGDYARTVFIGEPQAAAREAARAVAHAWQAVRERLRPGLRYSELGAIGREALRQGGFDVAVGFGPHSVGLMHTDEPGEDAGGFYRKLDLTLCENMVLSVDCPVMDTGLGGSAHIEDLMLITKDGAEPLHDIGAATIIV